jgi:hypothetical protein
MIQAIRRHFAKRRLQRLVEAKAQSREIIDYRIHRAAGKLGARRRKGMA